MKAEFKKPFIYIVKNIIINNSAVLCADGVMIPKKIIKEIIN